MNSLVCITLIFATTLSSCDYDSELTRTTFKADEFSLDITLPNTSKFAYIYMIDFAKEPYLFSYYYEDSISNSAIQISFQRRGNTDQDEFLSPHPEMYKLRVKNHIESSDWILEHHDIRKIDNYYVEKKIAFYSHGENNHPDMQPKYSMEYSHIYSFGLLNVAYIKSHDNENLLKNEIKKLQNVKIENILFSENFYCEIDTNKYKNYYSNTYKHD